MGSKCAVQNLGQSGRSTFFLSVWSGITLMSTKLCSHMTVHLSSPLKVSDFSTSPSLTSVCLKAELSLRFADVISSLPPVSSFSHFLSPHFFHCLPLQLPIQYVRLHSIACLRGLTESPFLLFPAHAHFYIRSRARSSS